MSIFALVLLGLSGCYGQTVIPSDAPAATGTLPVYLRALPQPEPEPWSRITEGQRFKQYTAMTFSPMAALGAITGGAISQGINSPKEWGQGWGAYGIRVTSTYGSTLVANTITYGTSALFHDDNRYFRSNSGTFLGRLGHVIASPYVARNNEGRKRFSTSMFLGSAGYSAIQLAWSPPSWQGWDDVGINYMIWYGQMAGVNLVREFYPSLVRHYRNKQAASPKKLP